MHLTMQEHQEHLEHQASTDLFHFQQAMKLHKKDRSLAEYQRSQRIFCHIRGKSEEPLLRVV